ncbi:IS21 family transposase [Polyangium sorediatum]|uniref:IS21 family transposase n=1 Tax=Polyangium sorediatum TaxID=889274 RepID=A0ABT6PAM6_9BACT|nr:IS21 family transposase [Polyangium sorediatum]MDI1437691.1 IS21 family transposase [Polyangium sorediatum]
MATERLRMRHVREILRQKLVLGRSNRQVSASLQVSSGAVSGAVTRARTLGLDWEKIAALGDDALEERLYGPRNVKRAGRPLPDPAYLHVELRRPGVTLQLLHLEYLEQHPNGYRYTAFCRHYNEWLDQQRPTMRQVHQGGDKLFVDYSGNKPRIVDPTTGEVTEVELFVAVLGASNFTFAEATRTQTVRDWIGSHVRALEAFGGVSKAIVPDQLKSGVTRSCRYEPGIQRTYEEMACHYGTTILPARPKSPRDKAKVEAGVLVAQRWILAKIRNQTFFSLAALNERIAGLVHELNERRMRVYGASRRELFERLDKPALGPLPAARFETCEWKTARVNIDYHVEYDHHFYSVPSTLLRQEVDIRATATTVEIFLRGERVASHPRSIVRGHHTTLAAHMPKVHQAHAEWSPTRILNWAATVGPATAKLAEAILASRPHPEQGYRSCLGLLRLSKAYGTERVEAACERAMAVGARSYRHVESILKHGLDRLAPSDTGTTQAPAHENIRGRDYYH